MRLKHCLKGDIVWVHDPYADTIVRVKVDGPYVNEQYQVKGIKVLFEDGMFCSYDIMDFNEECWKDCPKIKTE